MDVLGKAACEAKALELRKVLGKPAKLFIEWLIGAPAGTSLTRKIPARGWPSFPERFTTTFLFIA